MVSRVRVRVSCRGRMEPIEANRLIGICVKYSTLPEWLDGSMCCRRWKRASTVRL